MTSLPDIEASLEVCEILNLEVQTLSKDADALDADIAVLRAKEVELEQTIEDKKVSYRMLFETNVSEENCRLGNSPIGL